MTQRFAVGTVAGGLVLFFVGYLFFGLLLVDFFAANAGSATGVMRDPPSFAALALGQLAWGAVLTLILSWRGVSTFLDGAKTGALVGLLFFLGIDLTMYATTNINNLVASLVDAVVAAALFAIAGGAIAAVARRK